MGSESSKKLHIVMFPWFAYGHISPFIHLSKKLISSQQHNSIQISFFSIPGNLSRIKSALNLSPPHQLIPLTLPPTPGLPSNFDSSRDVTPQTSELLKTALDSIQPQIKSLLSNLKPHIILFDFAQHWIPPLANQLGIKAVSFCVFSAVSNAYLTVPSRMQNPENPPTIEDLKKPPKDFPETSTITAVKLFEARDFQYIFKRFNGGPSVFERITELTKTCDAFIYKTCTEIEGQYIEFIKSQIEKPLFLAGPAVPKPLSGEENKLDEKWEKWLRNHPEKSVIFCNFGSETYLSGPQIKEVVLGLELTKMPFFLVLNFESDTDTHSNKLEESLPVGFKERVGDKGVVYSGWVQQQLILAHPSVGCYLNHSGFSSVMEGIVSGCQLVFVPQKGDQFLNAKLMSEDLKVGVEVNRRDEDGYFGKEDILEAIKVVMVDSDKEPGRCIRKNHDKWRKFFVNKEVEDEYVANLVKELYHLAHDACVPELPNS